MKFGLKGKTVLITASSKGIGRAVADAFASEGCNVAICSRTRSDLLVNSKELKDKYNIDPLWCVCDLNKSSDIENTFNAVINEFGSIDVLVNNCGGPVTGYFNNLEEEDWNFAFEQVLMSVVRFSKLS